jgi:hypothetical protein
MTARSDESRLPSCDRIARSAPAPDHLQEFQVLQSGMIRGSLEAVPLYLLERFC